MSTNIEDLLYNERGNVFENYGSEMKSFSSTVFGLLRGRSLDQIFAIGVGSILDAKPANSVRQASVILNFEEKMKNAHENFWQEPLASTQEVDYFTSIGWQVKGKELNTDQFEDTDKLANKTTLFFMPRANHLLLNNVIKHLHEADALQNAFFITSNFFIREDSSESEDEVSEKSVPFGENKTVCGLPYLMTYLSECKFVPLPAFGGALADHAVFYSNEQIYFPIPTKIDEIMKQLDEQKTQLAAQQTLIGGLRRNLDEQQNMIDSLRGNPSSGGEPKRKKVGNS